MTGKSADLPTRFWAKVDRTSTCWIWTASKTNSGYGRIHVKIPNPSKFNGYTEYAHRVSWFLHTGQWPSLCILHSCDNPSCVNPAHLREGTMTENIAEAISKNRMHWQK